MATRESTAVKARDAMLRIEALAREAGKAAGHEYPPLPTQGHDRDVVRANQLSALADMLEDVLAMQGMIRKESD